MAQPVYQSLYGSDDTRIWKVLIDMLPVLVQAGMLKLRSFELEQILMREAQINMTTVTEGAHEMTASVEHNMPQQYQPTHAVKLDVLANYNSPLQGQEVAVLNVASCVFLLTGHRIRITDRLKFPIQLTRNLSASGC
eukprot:gene18246-21750_t